MDAFYASVELRRRPELRGKPVVVCGSGPRAVVTTASYEARKLAGIHSAMPAAVARRRLPDAVYLQPDFTAYREASGEVMAILRRNADTVEVVGLDEAYVDLTGIFSPKATMRRIATEIREETRLTCSIGISENRLLAKITSELGKPAGLVVLSREEALDALRRRPSRPRPRDRAEDRGEAAGDGHSHPRGAARPGPRRDDRGLRPAPRPLADLPRPLRGRHAAHRRPRGEVAIGRDDLRRGRPRSLAPGRLARLADRAALQAAAARELEGRTIGIKVRLDDWTTVTRAHTVEQPTNDPAVVGPIALDLLRAYDPPRPVRLLGVRLAAFEREATAEAERAPEAQLQLGLARLSPARERTHTCKDWAVSEDRLSGLDASFLHMERAGAHMHVASTIVFEGPAPTHEEFRDHIASRLHLVPRFRQKLRFVPFDQGRPVWVDDPHLNLDYHVRQTALPAPGLRGAAAQPRGADLLPAARPQQAALGAVAGRGPRGRPLLGRRQEPPRPGRRRSPASTSPRSSSTSTRSRRRRRPPPPRWQPRPEPTDLKLLGDALRERATSPREIVRGFRAALRGPRQVLAGPRRDRQDGRRRDGGPVDAVQRRDRPAPPPRLRPRRPGRAEAGQGQARRHRQRRHPLGRRRGARQLPAGARPRHRGPGDARHGPGQRPRRRGARRARQPDRGDDGAAPGLVRGPGRAAAAGQRVDGRPEGLRPGGRRRDPHANHRLRAADDRLAGGAAAAGAALLQPRRDQRARGRSSRSTCSGAGWRRSSRWCRWPVARRSASGSCPTTARSTSAWSATTTRWRTSTASASTSRAAIAEISATVAPAAKKRVRRKAQKDVEVVLAPGVEG